MTLRSGTANSGVGGSGAFNKGDNQAGFWSPVTDLASVQEMGGVVGQVE